MTYFQPNTIHTLEGWFVHILGSNNWNSRKNAQNIQKRLKQTYL